MRAKIQRNCTVGVGIFLLLIFLGQGLAFISANSPTYDEAMHLAAGYSYLARRDFRLELQNPPLIKVLSALPVYFSYRLPFDPDPEQWRRGEAWLIGQDFLYGSSLPADWILALSRVPNLLLGAVLVFNLQEVWTPDKSLFRWLYTRTPVAKIGYSIYVYDLTGDAEAHLRLAEGYIKEGLLSPVASELQKVLALDPSNSEAMRLLSLLLRRGNGLGGIPALFRCRPLDSDRGSREAFCGVERAL